MSKTMRMVDQEANFRAQVQAEQRFEQLVMKEKLLNRCIIAIKDLRNVGFEPDNNLKYSMLDLIEKAKDLEAK